MIKVNLFGNGIRCWICDIDQGVFEEMDKIRKHHPWETALTDYDFLKYFGYEHWSELSDGPEIIGLKLERNSVIEIKKRSKKLASFRANELNATETLFPLYQTRLVQPEVVAEDTRRLLIMELETGQTHSFSIDADEIRMEDVHFQIQEIALDLYCTGIEINNQPLQSIRNDTVHRGVRVINY